MGEQEGTKARYFLLSFALSFLVLSLMFLFLMSTVHPKSSPAASEQVTVVAEAFAPGEEHSLTVLFYGTESDGGVAGTYLLARFDPVRGSVPIVALPRQTVVTTPSGEQTLEEAYRYGGALYVRDALERTLGIGIDRYVRVTQSAFVAVAGAVGSVEFDLPESVEVDGIVYNEGKQLLDGKKALSLIAFDGWSGGEAGRCAAVAGLAAAIVDQRIDVALSTVVDRVFETVVDLVDTDISYADYEQRKQAAAHLAARGDVAVALSVSGRYEENDERFHLLDTSVANILQYFS